MVIRPSQNLPTGSHGHVICMGNLRGVFSQENTPERRIETHKSSIFPYKQVNGRNDDRECLRMTNAFISCDLAPFSTSVKIFQKMHKHAHPPDSQEPFTL